MIKILAQNRSGIKRHSFEVGKKNKKINNEYTQRPMRRVLPQSTEWYVGWAVPILVYLLLDLAYILPTCNK